jgi:hypothetical protein
MLPTRRRQLDSLWGVSGVNNVFKPGTLGGVKPTFVQFPQGQYAYNTDRNNIAPSLGAAWSAPARGGLFGTIFVAKTATASSAAVCRCVRAARHVELHGRIRHELPGLRITSVTDPN